MKINCLFLFDFSYNFVSRLLAFATLFFRVRIIANELGRLNAGRAEISETFEFKQAPACVKRLLCAVGGAEPVASSCVNRDNFVNG